VHGGLSPRAFLHAYSYQFQRTFDWDDSDVGEPTGENPITAPLFFHGADVPWLSGTQSRISSNPNKSLRYPDVRGYGKDIESVNMCGQWVGGRIPARRAAMRSGCWISLVEVLALWT